MFDINNFSSFALGEWVAPQGAHRDVHSAITGKVLGAVGDTLNVEAMRDYAKTHGGPALRALNFHDRSRMIKALALYLRDHRRALYKLSFETGESPR